MIDDTEFERRLQARVLAHAALASRPFDADQIAAAAAGAAVTVRPSPLRLRPVSLLVAAVLLLVLAAAAVLAVGSALPWFRADAEVVPPPLTPTSHPALTPPSADPDEAPTLPPDRQATPAPLAWSSLPAMSTPRTWHTATVLADGRVLVAGGMVDADTGRTASAEIFDPATSSWTFTGPMTTARAGHEAVLLPEGRVVVIGGLTQNSHSAAEVWDPSTGEWEVIGGLVPVPDDSAGLLPDGRILVAGGPGRTRAALLDPATGTWTQTDHYSEVRYNVSVMTLRDGTILLIGGDRLARVDRGMAAVEEFDPSSNGWSMIGALKERTHAYAPTLLDDGRILAVGADGQQFAQLFDPVSGRSTFVNGSLPAWAGGDGVRLADGRILFASIEGAGFFDPASESWESLLPMPDPRSGTTKSLLRTGAVLIVGGWTSPDGGRTIPSAAVELLR